MSKKVLYFDMDGVLVNFQSGIDKLSEAVRQEYEGEEYKLEMELEDAKLKGYTACMVCRGGENEQDG